MSGVTPSGTVKEYLTVEPSSLQADNPVVKECFTTYNHAEIQTIKPYPKYKDSGVEWIGAVPEHWLVEKVKYHLSYQKGKNPKELKPSFSEGSMIYLTMDYLREKSKQIYYVDSPENYLQVDNGEILLLWDGSNAGEFILSKKGVLSSTMAALNIHNVQKIFAWYYLKYYEKHLKESTIGMGIPHVNGEELKNGLITFPSPSEQTAIAANLNLYVSVKGNRTKWDEG